MNKEKRGLSSWLLYMCTCVVWYTTTSSSNGCQSYSRMMVGGTCFVSNSSWLSCARVLCDVQQVVILVQVMAIRVTQGWWWEGLVLYLSSWLSCAHVLCDVQQLVIVVQVMAIRVTQGWWWEGLVLYLSSWLSCAHVLCDIQQLVILVHSNGRQSYSGMVVGRTCFVSWNSEDFLFLSLEIVSFWQKLSKNLPKLAELTAFLSSIFPFVAVSDQSLV